jgi:hypothetical protein
MNREDGAARHSIFSWYVDSPVDTSFSRSFALNVSFWLGMLFSVGAFATPPQNDLRFQEIDVHLYDQTGRYQGRSDRSGHIYDSKGRYEGRSDESQGTQRLYDAQGRYHGKIEYSGRSYDAQGRYLGRQDLDGRMYDSLAACRT